MHLRAVERDGPLDGIETRQAHLPFEATLEPGVRFLLRAHATGEVDRDRAVQGQVGPGGLEVVDHEGEPVRPRSVLEVDRAVVDLERGDRHRQTRGLLLRRRRLRGRRLASASDRGEVETVGGLYHSDHRPIESDPRDLDAPLERRPDAHATYASSSARKSAGPKAGSSAIASPATRTGEPTRKRHLGAFEAHLATDRFAGHPGEFFAVLRQVPVQVHHRDHDRDDDQYDQNRSHDQQLAHRPPNERDPPAADVRVERLARKPPAGQIRAVPLRIRSLNETSRGELDRRVQGKTRWHEEVGLR